MTPIDTESFLDQTIFGMDTSAMLNDVLDFLNFSERNINEQRELELRQVQSECHDADIDDEYLAGLYLANMMDSVKYRFDVLLTQRVRYAALTSTITTVEWVLTALSKRLKNNPTPLRAGDSKIVHLQRELFLLAGMPLPQPVALELLVQIRNCVTHTAGLVDSDKKGTALRERLEGVAGVTVSNINFIGNAVEIKHGYLQRVLEEALQWLPRLEQSLHKAGAFVPSLRH